jgi:hypothetical protein
MPAATGSSVIVVVTRSDSVFEADCPQCGMPLETVVSSEVAEGLIWYCGTCGLRSERSGGLLIDTIDTSDGPQPADH